LSRINVARVDLPPLRSRGGDVLLLAQHMLQRCAARLCRRVASLAPAAAERLLSYSWPGNVRELHGCIERAVALAEYDQIGVDDLPGKLRRHRLTVPDLVNTGASELMSLDEIERRYILHVLDFLAGNKWLAAQILGMDRHTLYRKLDRYGLRA
jgi:two-component system, NtrC family, response regulator AtoC